MEIKPQDIKDFLHLYLNSVDVIIESVSDEYKSHFGHAPGHKTQLGPMLWMIVFEGHVKIKPILRKLSDMTEEEMKEFKKLIPHIDFVRFEPKGNKWVYIEHEQDGKHETRAVCTTTAMIGSIPMSAMPYLLRQGFDLFGLIPAGLAIDKTSLKN